MWDQRLDALLRAMRPIARDYKEMLEARKTILGEISYRRRVEEIDAVMELLEEMSKN